MAICYSANIGGTGTLVGTGSNVVMMEYLNEFDDNPVSFGTWMGFAIPQMLLCLAAAWLWLYFYFVTLSKWRGDVNANEDEERSRRNMAVSDAIGRKYAELGTLTFHEMVVLFLFVAAFLLWFFLSPGFMTGWGDKLESENGMGYETSVDDATPAILIAVLLFAMPAKPNFFRALSSGRSDPQGIEPSPPVLTWKTAQHKV